MRVRASAELLAVALAVTLGGCRVNETLCIELMGNELDPRSGCVARGTVPLPGSECVKCPEDGCGIDLRCMKSSCVVDPDGRVYVIFCVDATMREWPEGWRAIPRRQVPDDPALTDPQRATCLSAAVHERYCRINP